MNLRCATVYWFSPFKELNLQEVGIMGGIEIPLDRYPPGIQVGETFIPVQEACIEELLKIKVVRKPIVPWFSRKSVKNLVRYVNLQKKRGGKRILAAPNLKSHSRVHLLVVLYAKGRGLEITASDGMIIDQQIWNTDQPAYNPWQIVKILAIVKTGNELKVSSSDTPGEKYEGVLTCADKRGGRNLIFKVNRLGVGEMKLFRENAE
ncbi:MAG: hypothetical protein PHW01_01945 [Patescibacteria group bacterium]|nr:hypothetical protein [Patescibacteria group bacterium]